MKNGGNNIIDIDIFGGAPEQPAKQPESPPFSFEQPSQPVNQPQQVIQPPQQVVQPPQQVAQPPPQQVIQPPQQVVQPPPQQIPVQQPFYGQAPGQAAGQPVYNQYGQVQAPYNQYAPQPGYSQGPQPGYPQQSPYGHPGVPQQAGYNAGMPQQAGYSPYVNPMYPATAPLAGQVQQKGSLNTSNPITLNSEKKDEEFGNFSSSNQGTAQNVRMLIVR